MVSFCSLLSSAGKSRSKNGVGSARLIPVISIRQAPCVLVGMAGTSPAMTTQGHARASSIFNCQTAHAASSSRRVRPRLFKTSPRRMRGDGAPQGANVFCLASPCEGRSASPCGAPSRRFGARGPCFRDRTGAVASPIRRAFVRLRPGLVQPSERQSHVVGPDGDPKPPGRSGCETAARRRRHLIPPRERLRRRPLADEAIGI